MKLTVLGTGGGGSPRLGRAGSAALVTVGDDRLLFDCGPSATVQLLRAGVRPEDVGPLFLTHHHFDHLVDLPYFAMSSWIAGREEPLSVFGPVGTSHIVDMLFGADGAFDADLRARSESPAAQRIYMSRHGKTRDRMRIVAIDLLTEGPIHESAGWRVSAARMPHTQPFMESLAYRVDSGDRSVVISGDTAPSAAMEAFAAGADVLLHECTRPDDDLIRLGLEHHHTGPIALGAIAQRAGVATLVLTHFSIEHGAPGSVERMATEVRRHFTGETVVGSDLLELEA